MTVLKRETEEGDFPAGLSESSKVPCVRGPLRGLVERKSRDLRQLRIKGRRVDIFLQPHGSINNHTTLKEEQKVAPERNTGR